VASPGERRPGENLDKWKVPSRRVDFGERGGKYWKVQTQGERRETTRGGVAQDLGIETMKVAPRLGKGNALISGG